MKKILAVAVTMFLLASAAQAASLTYAERVSGTSTFLDITAAEGADTIWTMSVNLGRADSHAYWTKGEIASFKDVSYGGTAFEYSPEPSDVASGGMYAGGLLSQSTFSDTGGRGASAYVFSASTTMNGATATFTTTINAPTNITALGGGIYNYTSVITTDCAIVNPVGNGVANIDGLTSNYRLAPNHGGYTGWDVANPIVAGQAYPNVHANTAADGHELYDIVDWYGDLGGNNNYGFLIDMTVNDSTEAGNLNMREGLNFNLINDDISLNYCDRSNNNIGTTDTDNDAALKGLLTNAREAYNALPDGTGGGSMPDGATWNGTTTLTISAPIPEPATMGLLGLGLLGLVVRRKKK
jgi:PEP-CTERM motif-containing protein